MRRSIRKLVAGGAAALALGGFLAVIIAPQLASAHGISRTAQPMATVTTVVPRATALSAMSSSTHLFPKVIGTATPTAACTAALQALKTWKANDAAEDAAERARAASDPNFRTNDVAEDKAEWAAVKPLIDAAWAACGSARPAPSAACLAAKQSLRTAWANHADRATLTSLWQAVRSACGFGFFTFRHH